MDNKEITRPTIPANESAPLGSAFGDSGLGASRIDAVADLAGFYQLSVIAQCRTIRRLARIYKLSLATWLICFYTEHPGARPSLSTLVAGFGVGRRTIQRTRDMLVAEGSLLPLERAWFGKQELPPGFIVDQDKRFSVNRLFNKDEDHPGAAPRVSSVLSLDPKPQDPYPDLKLERQTGRARTHARVRESARASSARPHPARRHQAPRGGAFRQPRRDQPVLIESGVWRALSARYGGHAVSVLRREVHFERYHQSPEETSRALRTLLVRTPQRTVLEALRGFFKLALRGEGLCDEPDWVRSHLEAEARALHVDAPIDFDLDQLVAEIAKKGESLDAEALHARAVEKINEGRSTLRYNLTTGVATELRWSHGGTVVEVVEVKPLPPPPPLTVERGEVLGHLTEEDLDAIDRGEPPPSRRARVTPAPRS
jgi:hypothetical protein